MESVDATILLVDADSDVLAETRQSLQEQGFRIRCTTNADEALRMLRTDEVDVVVAGQILIGMSGTEFLGQVHRLFPLVGRVLLATDATVEMLLQAINRDGIQRIYLKPVDQPTLLVAIRELVNGRRLLKGTAAATGSPDSATSSNASTQSDWPAGGEREVTIEEAACGWDTLVRRLEDVRGLTGG